MSEPKLVSPLLDGFALGAPLSSHAGVNCFPAMKENSDNKYIVKVISVPASQVQLDALLVTGAYKDPAAALDYFRQQADELAEEAEFLKKLAKLEGFLSFEGCQVSPMKKNRLGYHVYLLSDYRRSLERYMHRSAITHLEAVNLGLDMCAALAVCRRAGYMYIDLKPNNIFISDSKEYRIGDLGFTSMDFLKYTSMPERYISSYTAPEVRDPMCPLNETVDTYALGMILYRIFNNGELPTMPDDPSLPLSAPVKADPQMAEIILKACAPKPDDRYQDPSEMGQALAEYMQSNTVNDVAIAPILPYPLRETDAPDAAPEIAEAAQAPEETAEEQNASDTQATRRYDPAALEALAAGKTETEAEEAAPEENPETVAEAAEETPEEAIPEELPAEAAPAAEGVLPDSIPENTDRPEENSIASDGEEDDAFDLESELASVQNLLHSSAAPGKAAVTTPAGSASQRTATATQPAPKKKKKHTGRNILITVLVLLMLAICGFWGFWFYQNYYLLNVYSITIEGNQDGMTVTLETDAEDDLLTVSCTDTYGNTLRQNVADAAAVFTDLTPGSLYKISVEAKGLHKLQGQISDVYTTESSTEIVNFSAITGQEDGAVLLNITVHGHEPEEWIVTCSAEGEESVTQSFTGHSATIRNLTIAKEYTFRLAASDGTSLIGQDSMTFTPASLIPASNLAVISRINGEMTVAWDAPKDLDVENWTVRCFSDNYDETQTVEGTIVTFLNTEEDSAYSIEVTAAGMTQPTRLSISANPINMTAIKVDTSDKEQLTVTWTFEGKEPDGGWLLLYTVDNSNTPNVIKCVNASAVITPAIPGAAYSFTVQATDSTSVFNNVYSFTNPVGDLFTSHGLSAYRMNTKLLPTPEEADWLADNIASYTDTFTAGSKISMVLTGEVNFHLNPPEEISILYVIRDENGKVLLDLVGQATANWYDMFFDGDYHMCELDIPAVPTAPGKYSVDLYFNGLPVTSTEFTITE